nr:MAG TPA: hypothetical protein [Caudoviricetes sp.]
MYFSSKNGKKYANERISTVLYAFCAIIIT